MADFQIFSDGACDLGLKRASELNIKMVPFYVSIDHKTYYKELVELSLDEYFRCMTEKKIYPKTSLPSVQDYIDAFRPTLEAGRDILCLTMTDTLTSSIQSAQTAKSILLEDFPNVTIEIVNSWHATGSQALLLMEAARMRDNGKTLAETSAYIQKARVDARIHFMVGDLSYLEIGGRIGKLATLSGSVLKIKPIIILKDGEISIGGVVRSRKKGLAKIVEVTKQHFQKSGENPVDYIATCGTTTAWDEMDEFEALIRETVPDLHFIPHFQIGATIATHTGPGTTGLCFVKKYENYGF